jgi:hypothetical protein
MRQSYEADERESPNYYECREGEIARFDIISNKPPDEDRDRPNETLWKVSASEHTTEPQRIAIMLMAGAIFGTILFFLIGKHFMKQYFLGAAVDMWLAMRRGTTLLADQHDFLIPDEFPRTSGEILAQNCRLLIKYLGLRCAAAPACALDAHESKLAPAPNSQSTCASSSHPLSHENLPHERQAQCSMLTQYMHHQGLAEEPCQNNSISPNASTPSSTQPSFSAKSTPLSETSQTLCPYCNKSFSTITNRNRHRDKDCKRAQRTARTRFPCRNTGCKQHFTRKAYQLKHEQERCKARQR